jgi:hypothetical protein
MSTYYHNPSTMSSNYHDHDPSANPTPMSTNYYHPSANYYN